MDPRGRNDAVECCHWCRQPSWMCRDASCDDTPTYAGTLDRGQWVESADSDPSRVLVAAGR